jgi:YHS domain-containing protein
MAYGGSPRGKTGPTQGFTGGPPSSKGVAGKHIAPPHTDVTTGASPRPEDEEPVARSAEPLGAISPDPLRHAATHPVVRGPADDTQGAAVEEAVDEGETKELDPVCGREVEPSRAAGTSTFAGQEFFFCSRSCKDRFDAHPGEFVGTEDAPIPAL